MDTPFTPDWLMGFSKKENKIDTNPNLEIIRKISSNPELINDYFFPRVLLNKKFNLSTSALEIAHQLIKNETQLIDYFIACIKGGITYDKLLLYSTWRFFEELVEAIFQLSGWNTIRNYRFKSIYNHRVYREIDLIAWQADSEFFLLVECKKYKNSDSLPLLKVVENNLERSFQFQEALPEIGLDQRFSSGNKILNRKIYPIIITWKDHQFRYCQVNGETLAVCQIADIQNFLNNMRSYLSNCFNLAWNN